MSGLWDAAQLWALVSTSQSLVTFAKGVWLGFLVGQHKQQRNQQAQSDAMNYFQYEPFRFQRWHFSALTVLVFSVSVSALCLELRLVRHHCRLHLAACAGQVYHQSDTNTNTVNHTARRLTIAPLISRPPAAQQCRVSTGRRTCTAWVRDWTSWEAEWDFIWWLRSD